MQHQIIDQICQCEDGKFRLKKNCIYFQDSWYETDYLEEETILYNEERYWKDDCHFSNYLEEYLPDEIFHEDHFFCVACDTYYHNNEESEHTYDSSSYCSDCFYNDHTYCHNCDEAISNDNSNYSEITQHDYCESCYQNYHGYCDRCGTDYWLDDGCDCSTCIHNYSYRPDPIFHKSPKEKAKYYIGIELETESKGNSKHDCADEVADISDLLYLKNDGSLEDGFEVVTHPFSYSWYLEHTNLFNDLLNTLRDNGFRSYNTTTCGIHIHITKSYLSGLDIAKLHLFFYQNENFVAQISQRKIDKLDQWGKIKKDKKAIYDQSKKKGGSERYTAINLQNYNTIEFRIFRGTLNENSYHKNIEFVIALCDFIKVTSLQQLNKEQFYSYIKQDKHYKNLRKFMEEKQCA
jgi:hypothetical protein